jgi:hypothetical protein
MDTDKKTERNDARAAKLSGASFAVSYPAFAVPLLFAPSVFIRVHQWLKKV